MGKPTTLLVTAAHPDRPCPKDRSRTGPYDKARPWRGKPRDLSMIYPDEVVEVPNDYYYRRRIAKGDLKLADGPAPKSAPKKAKG